MPLPEVPPEKHFEISNFLMRLEFHLTCFVSFLQGEQAIYATATSGVHSPPPELEEEAVTMMNGEPRSNKK